jgi:hypothetical protein
MQFPNGSYFHGQFLGGKREGEGLVVYASKDRFSGQWKAGKKHGKGTYIVHKTNSRLKGTWEAGELRTGQWVLANGSTFNGSFENKFPAGEGVWTLQNGHQVHGKYVQKSVEAGMPIFPKVKSEFYNQEAPKLETAWETA